MGVADAEYQAGSVEVAAEGEEDARARLRERAYELGLRPPRWATVGELERMVADNDLVDLSQEKRAELLDYIRANPRCSLREACAKTRLRRAEVRALLKQDREFYEDHEEARGRSLEKVYEAVDRLVFDGVRKPLVSAGKLVRDDNGEIVEVVEYSEKMTEFLYRARTPEGRSVDARRLGIEITGADGGPIQVQAGVDLSDVAKVLAAAGVQLPALVEAPEGAAEIVAVEDEPVE